MISALSRKLLRDLWQIRGQAAAIAAVMGCGIATFVMALCAMESLEYTRTLFYDRFQFADLFAHVKRAPLSLVHRLQEIPGVKVVDTRIVRDVTLDVEGLRDPAVGRLISIPDERRASLNRLHLRKGRHIEPGAVDEVLVSERFAESHGLGPGDSVKAIINGRLRQLDIVGLALSPEYVYLIRPGDIIPDPTRYGIFWMNRKSLEAAFDMEGAFNDVTFQLMPHANVEEVIRQTDLLTATYGGLGAYSRKDQISNQFLDNEIKQLQGMGTIIPSIFLAVSAFLLNLVVGRIVGTQREQIAALKALGYTNRAVGWHFFQMALMTVGVGWILGAIAGAILGRTMTVMYTEFFNFPVLEYRLSPRNLTMAAGVAVLSGFLGTFGSVRRAVKLPPAEAMRPEPPAQYRPTVLERLGMARFFSNTMRMIVRHLERTPVKSAMSILGIAMAVAILVLGRVGVDSILRVIAITFDYQQRQDVIVTFIEPRSQRAIHEIEHLPGVMRVEPIRSVPVKIRFGHQHRRAGVIGLSPDATLFRLVNEQIRAVSLPEDGLVLGDKLAELIGAKAGDTVTLEVLEGARPVKEVVVVGLVSEFLGSNPYMDIGALNDLMVEGSNVSGAYVRVDSLYIDEMYAALKETPGVASVTIKEAAVENFKKTMGEMMFIMTSFQMAFAVIIAFGVVYNAARIAVSERGRELASLRVLGFTRVEISWILLGELAILTVVAIPIGLLLGYLLAWMVSIMAFDTDMFRIPFYLEAATYARAILVVALAALVSGLFVRRKLDHLDLIAVLKTKE